MTIYHGSDGTDGSTPNIGVKKASDGKYITRTENITGMGVAGSCVSAKSDYGTSNSPLINRYETIPESDVITIFMGTNDYGHETPLGTIDDQGTYLFSEP